MPSFNSHRERVETLTTVFGFSAKDAQRALTRCAGNIEQAAELLLEGHLRRRATSNTFPTISETAGPSSAPSTSSYDEHEHDTTSQLQDSKDSEDISSSSIAAAVATIHTVEDSEEELSDLDSDQDDLYAPPSPIRQQPIPQSDPCSTLASTHNHRTFGVSSNTEGECAQCVCTLPNSLEMIQCTTCERWFHYDCVHLTSSTIPDGDYYCHFESNSNTAPYNNAGNRMDDIESRALYLTVRKFAKLGPKFWENVSQYMLTNFHIVRSVTSVKMEWLRYASAWWGYDERNCKQWGEEDVKERHKLYRSNQKDQESPPLIWKFLGMAVNRAEPTAAKKARKPRAPTKSAQKPRTPKRKRASTESDNDSEDDMPVPSIKRTKNVQRIPVPPPNIGGKYVGSQEIFTSPAQQTPEAMQMIREADLDEKSWQYVNSAAANAAVLAQLRSNKAASIDPLPETDPLVSSSVVADDDVSVGVGFEGFMPGAIDGTLLPAYNSVEDLSNNYYNGGGSSAPVFQSRFEALAEHRQFVMDSLRDIEPGLDWCVGPWPEQKSELLWGGDEELEYGAMFSI